MHIVNKRSRQGAGTKQMHMKIPPCPKRTTFLGVTHVQ